VSSAILKGSGSILLGQVAEHLATLEIVCNRCDRKGKVSVDRLMSMAA